MSEIKQNKHQRLVLRELTDYEKINLTQIFADYRLLPDEGCVIYHFNRGRICKVIPQPQM